MRQVVQVSKHALQRFRERFGSFSMSEDVVTAYNRATSAPAWIRKQITQTEGEPEKSALVDGEVVLIVAKHLVRPDLEVIVIVTVIPLDCYFRSRLTKYQVRQFAEGRKRKRV